MSQDGSRSPQKSKSPERPQTRDNSSGGNGRDLAVTQVVRESGGSAQYLMLTRTNYGDWALMMKVMMQVRGLWDAVENYDADFHEDRMALEAIIRVMPPEILSTLAIKESAKEAWYTIKTMHMSWLAAAKDSSSSLLLCSLRVARVPASRDFDCISVDAAVEWILRYFVDNPRDTRVIYFDGWRGFGASTVLRAVADAVTPPELHLDKVIHIDCSAWKSRRATQRAIAVELNLGHSVMAVFDKEDEEDDFNGVDEGSRGEILDVAQMIGRTLRDIGFMMVFHNGSGDDIDLNSFGVPPSALFGANLTLWTFRRRFRAREPYSVKSAHLFVYESEYDITGGGIFFPVLRRLCVAANNPCMRETNPERIVRCCLYELFLHLSFPKITEYDWPARASSYWMCDGIIQGDRAWEISNALREEIKWELHPDLLDNVRRRFLNKFGSKNSPQIVLTFKDKHAGAQQPYPWIAITSRNNLQTEDMLQATNAKVSSCFLASGSPDHVPLVLADDLFNQSTNLRVLHLSCCAFSFASPPFTSCHNLRFLGLDHCKDSIAGEGEDQRKWEFLRSLWALDLSHTDWYQVLSKEMTDLMELNVEGVEFSCTSLVWGQMHNLHKVRIINPVYLVPKTSTNVDNTFIGKTKLQLVDLSGNKDMKILPSSLSTASSLEVLILDGCNDLENVAAPDCLPPSLKSFSLDGYGPASHWTPVVELPPKKCRPSSADQKHAKITKISLEGCTQLENLFLRGLPNLVELDLSRTAIKTLDFETIPGLKRLFLLACERLRVIKWDIWPKLELLCIDTRAGIECPRPSFDLNKSFRLQVHATIADARLARSLWFPLSDYRSTGRLVDVYFNISITSSPVYSSGVVQLESTSEEKIGLGDHQVSRQQLVPANRYGDVISMVGDAPMHAFPQPPSTKLDRHIEIAEGRFSVKSELVYSTGYNLADLIWCAESLHVHDVSINASMPSMGYHLRQCRVESCPTLETVFPAGSYGFDELQTIWASDLLMARCIWSKGSQCSFRNLQHLHLRSCTRLQFVLPVWVSSFPSLETLHIIHCGDLRHVFVLDGEYPKEIPFPKLTTVHLHDLPMLRQMCEVKMVAPALETIRIRGCWGMRRLSVVARGEGKKKLTVDIEKDVWDALEWDGVEANHHSSFFERRHSRYYKKKLPRVSVLR